MKPDPYDYVMYLWSNGTAFVDQDGNLDGNLNSEKAIEAVSMFQNMEKDGYAIATEKNGTDEFEAARRQCISTEHGRLPLSMKTV